MTQNGPLVSTHWLGEHLQDQDLRLIDASWRLPGQGHAHADYQKRHIPGAVFFDIDAVADKETGLPHMLPPAAIFETAVGACGISDKDRVVVYDDTGVFSAPRVWWTFRAMGHEQVFVLDGGLPKWRVEGRSLTDAQDKPMPALYKAAPVKNASATHNDIRSVLQTGAAAIADARPGPRFRGQAPEPREGLRSGAMPGAVNVPYKTLLTEDGTYLEPDALKARFLAAGVDLAKPVITTCGSGVTAAVLSLALNVIGHRHNSLYDGSWSEWGDEKNSPVEFPVRTERNGEQTP